jgi:hypothetical protein
MVVLPSRFASGAAYFHLLIREQYNNKKRHTGEADMTFYLKAAFHVWAGFRVKAAMTGSLVFSGESIDGTSHFVLEYGLAEEPKVPLFLRELR